MKILSWNVNGFRAVMQRGFMSWLTTSGADIICLQEVKLQETQVQPTLFDSGPFQSYFNTAAKPGYSGVAVYARVRPLHVARRLGLPRFDEEGRFLRLEFPDFTLINIYLPHGGRQKENLDYKLKVYDRLIDYLTDLQIKNPVLNLVMVGDFNVAHKEIDLARPKENHDNIMFTVEERKQVNRIIELGFTDTFRQLHLDGGHYTWWPYYASARDRNLGWRIDYVFTNLTMTKQLKDAFILSDVPGSDHCPVGIEL